MIKLTLYCGLSSMQLAPSLSATNTSWNAIKHQVTCPEMFQTSTLVDCKTFISTNSVVGVTIGSIFGGVFVAKGRRINVIIFNLVLILSSLMSIDKNWWILNLGRVVFGFASGVLLCATPKIIEESIPTHLMDYGFGTSTNMFINIMITVYMLLGIGMPTSEEALMTTNYWVVPYLLPIPFGVLAIFLALFTFKQDSINFHV